MKQCFRGVVCNMDHFIREHKKRERNKALNIFFDTLTPEVFNNDVLYQVDDELYKLLIDAHKKLGILKGTVKHLPNREIIANLMLLTECYYSRKVDFTDMSITEFFKALALDNNVELIFIKNIITAYKFSLSSNEPFNNALLSKTSEIALYGNEAEQIKSEMKKFASSGGIKPFKRYDPISPARTEHALADILNFIYKDDKIDILIRAALSHHQFIRVQPYECFNGIIGRILILKLLIESDIIQAPITGLSEYLYQIKDDYRAVTLTTRYSGGHITLIKFFLRVFHDSAKLACERIEQISGIFEDDEKKINDCETYTKTLLMVYDYFKANICSQIKVISGDLKLSYNTITKSVNTLCDLGILCLEKDQSRHRVFVYKKLMEALTDTIFDTLE